MRNNVYFIWFSFVLEVEHAIMRNKLQFLWFSGTYHRHLQNLPMGLMTYLVVVFKNCFGSILENKKH